MVLALAMVPLLIVPLVVELSPGTERALLAIDYVIWAIFAVEYIVKLTLTPDRLRFVKQNIPALVIVLVPILRPLRILRSARLLRLLRLTRIAAFAAEGVGEVRMLFRRGVNYVLLIVVAVVIVSAGLIVEFERGAEGGNIESFPDALWWAATTITTVGYGDHFPTTVAGRGVALGLMIAGIALFGVITATIAAYFVEHDAAKDADVASDTIAERLDEISNRLAAIEDQLRSQT